MTALAPARALTLRERLHPMRLAGFAAKTSCVAFWFSLAVVFLAPEAEANSLSAMFGWIALPDSYGVSIWAYMNALPSGDALDSLSIVGGLAHFLVAAEITFMVVLFAVILWLFGIFMNPFWAALFSGIFTIVGASMSEMVLNQRIGYWCAFISTGVGLCLLFTRQSSKGRQLILLGVLLGAVGVPLAVSQGPEQITPKSAVVAFEQAGASGANELIDRGNKQVAQDTRPGTWLSKLQGRLATDVLRHSVQILVYGTVLDDINNGQCAAAWNEGIASPKALFVKATETDTPLDKINPVAITLHNKLDQFCGPDVVEQGQSADLWTPVLGAIVAWLVWRLARPLVGAGVGVGQNVYNFYADIAVSPLPVAFGAAGGPFFRFLKLFAWGILGALFYVYVFVLILGLYALILTVGVSHQLEAVFPPAKFAIVKIVIAVLLAHFTQVWIANKVEQAKRASAEAGHAHESGRRSRKGAQALAGAFGGAVGGFAGAAAMPVRNPALTSRLLGALNGPSGGGGSGASKGAEAAQTGLSAAGPWGRAAALGLAAKGWMDRRKDKAENLTSSAKSWGGSSPRPAGAPERAPKNESKDTPEQQYNSSIQRGGLSPSTADAPKKGKHATDEMRATWRQARRTEAPAAEAPATTWKGTSVAGRTASSPERLKQARAAYEGWMERNPAMRDTDMLEARDTSQMTEEERKRHTDEIGRRHSEFWDWMSK